MIRKIAVFLPVFLVCLTLCAQQLDHYLGDILIRTEQDVSAEDICEEYKQFFHDKSIRIERSISDYMKIYLLRFDANMINERLFLLALKDDQRIIDAQYNHIIYYRETIPNDPLFNSQWQWFNLGQGGGMPDSDIDLELAWDHTTGGLTSSGDTIVVAVVDDGIDLDHPDFNGNLWVNSTEIAGNGIDDDNNGYVDDYLGWNTETGNDQIDVGSHGVRVSGMVGAVGNNAFGVVGVNWNIKIMTVINDGVSEASAIEAYSYILNQRMLYNATNGAEGAFIVSTNSSWGKDFGQPDEAPLWCGFYDTLGAHGILSVAATMNLPQNVDVVGDLPTGCGSEFLISVTSTDRNDQRASAAFGLESIDLAAPGQAIFTTSSGGLTATTSGTSFASPVVAGLAALLYSVDCSFLGDLARTDPPEAARIVRDAIFESIDHVATLATETKFGGRVNANNAVLNLLDKCGSCPKPLGVHINDVTDISALISWIGGDSSNTFDLRWKVFGSPDWTIVEDIQPPFSFTGLEACTSYEFQISGNCKDTISGYSESIVFESEGCCVLPEGLAIESIDETMAEAVWSPIFAARNYALEIRRIPNGSWQEVVTGEESFIFEGLSPCTDYEIRLRTDCDTLITGYSDKLSFQTKGCGACLDSIYCNALGLDTDEEWIESLEIGPYIFHTGQSQGYASFLHEDFELAPGRTYPVTIVPGFSGFAYEEFYRIWIDLNQNGVFDNAGELLLDLELPTNMIVTDSIHIPETAPRGFTRMRVSQKYRGPFYSKPQACGEFGSGEVEDYCLTLADEVIVTCPKVSEFDTSAVDMESASIIWNSIEPALGFNYRFRKVGSQNWDIMVTLDTFAILSGLEECTEYEFQLLTICPQDTSGFSDTLFFVTKCANAVKDLDPLLSDVKIYPNPFTDHFSLEFTPHIAGEAVLRIFTLDGNVLETRDIVLERGWQNQIQVEADGYLPGMYFASLQAGERLTTFKLLCLGR